MSPRALATMQALGRVAIGGTLVAAPQLVRGWLGPAAAGAPTQVAARALGIRDLALGAGALIALRSGDGARTWVLLGLLADLVDGVATVAARDELPAGGVAAVGAVAFGSAGLAAAVQSSLD